MQSKSTRNGSNISTIRNSVFSVESLIKEDVRLRNRKSNQKQGTDVFGSPDSFNASKV